MSQREAHLLWLKDILEHLGDCRQRLEWAESQEMAQVVAETMIRELDRCRQVCEAIQQRPVARAVA